jgi:hypothetical protein
LARQAAATPIDDGWVEVKRKVKKPAATEEGTAAQ